MRKVPCLKCMNKSSLQCLQHPLFGAIREASSPAFQGQSTLCKSRLEGEGLCVWTATYVLNTQANRQFLALFGGDLCVKPTRWIEQQHVISSVFGCYIDDICIFLCVDICVDFLDKRRERWVMFCEELPHRSVVKILSLLKGTMPFPSVGRTAVPLWITNGLLWRGTMRKSVLEKVFVEELNGVRFRRVSGVEWE